MIITKIAKHNNFPTLETERLILRQMTLEDTDFVFRPLPFCLATEGLKFRYS